MVCIQELFIGNWAFSDCWFNLYWPADEGNQKDVRVFRTIRKNTASNIIFDKQSDLATNFYCIILDVKELHPKTEKAIWDTRIINMYDNLIGQRYTWQGHTSVVWWAIKDITWSKIIQGRVLLLGDMNAHSPSWNPHCGKRQNAKPLKHLIDKYKLIVNNNTDYFTCPQSQRISIIDLALTTASLGPLTLWESPVDYSLVSDNELILL